MTTQRAETTQTAAVFSWGRALRRPTTLVALALLIGVALVWTITLAQASQPKTLDQKVNDVASQLQCPICHGESVAASPSDLARQMRAIIRQKLASGESEQQVINYFTQRYGDSILMTPPLATSIWMWTPPVAMLLLGVFLVCTLGREWQAQRPAVASGVAGGGVLSDEQDEDAEALADLSAADQRRLRELLRSELANDEGAPIDAFADDEAHERQVNKAGKANMKAATAGKGA